MKVRSGFVSNSSSSSFMLMLMNNSNTTISLSDIFESNKEKILDFLGEDAEEEDNENYSYLLEKGGLMKPLGSCILSMSEEGEVSIIHPDIIEFKKCLAFQFCTE